MGRREGSPTALAPAASTERPPSSDASESDAAHDAADAADDGGADAGRGGGDAREDASPAGAVMAGERGGRASPAAEGRLFEGGWGRVGRARAGA